VTEGALIHREEIPLENGSTLVLERYQAGTRLLFEKRAASGQQVNAWLDTRALVQLVKALCLDLLARGPSGVDQARVIWKGLGWRLDELKTGEKRDRAT